MNDDAERDPHAHRYSARLADEIERRWQARWDEAAAFRQPNPGEPGFDPSRPRFYCLDMFPYPSGAGLHVGHPEGYTATDIISRFRRMQGCNVLHPMGWDAFGLPAEQYAIQTGVHPAITTRTAIDNFRRQLRRFGFSYDWSREFGTIDEDYYRWTQWIFLRLYDAWFDPAARKARPIADLVALASRGEIETPAPWSAMDAHARRAFLDSRRLAYLSEMVVNWCPKLGTVLANDEVIDGRSERGGHPVVRKPLRQWTLRITAYAERLLEQLEWLDWPVSTKAMQAEWIGRSTGAEITFPVAGHAPLRIFTTRPDTIFGATYMVVAPEHPLVDAVLAAPPPACNATGVRAYADRAKSRSDVERMEDKRKTGVFLGVHATNPATGEAIPVWVADYVLATYGTGAIMAVPAHDQRDFEFARAFDLPIRDVVYPRAVLAIRWFCAHAPGVDDTGASWREYLADMLGLCAADTGVTFDRAWEIVRSRRRDADTSTPARPGPRRGTTRNVWIEVLDDLGVASLDELRDRFRRHAYHDHHGEAFAEPGLAANSANADVSLDGLHQPEATATIIPWLERTGAGRARTQHRLRDWVFSRQRYWGEPFPIVYDDEGNAYPVHESRLPVRLPDLADYTPVESDDPQPLLAKAADWVRTTAGEAGVDPALLPPGTPVRRETNTMPGSAGSSWYAIRYCDAHSSARFVGADAEAYWMGPRDGQPAGGVDLYVGGSEHAVGHLLYARFWQNVLFDLGFVHSPEPFRRLFHQGLITSFAYQRADKTLVPVDAVEERGEGVYVERATGASVTQIVAKMSKSLKNVVNPDDVIGEYGADTFRLYEMYMGPLEASKPWNPRDITGLHRFLQRLWRCCVSERDAALRTRDTPDPDLEKRLHRLIAKAAADIDRLSFNTAIAAMIEFVNACVAADKDAPPLTRDQVSRLALVLSPFAPHLAEEIWATCGTPGFAMHQRWPAHDEAMLHDDEVEVPVQVQGKVRGRVRVPAGADAPTHERLALEDPRVRESIADRPVKKIIVVPGRMINVVV